LYQSLNHIDIAVGHGIADREHPRLATRIRTLSIPT
jgi:hypothetical protein